MNKLLFAGISLLTLCVSAMAQDNDHDRDRTHVRKVIVTTHHRRHHPYNHGEVVSRVAHVHTYGNHGQMVSEVARRHRHHHTTVIIRKPVHDKDWYRTHHGGK